MGHLEEYYDYSERVFEKLTVDYYRIFSRFYCSSGEGYDLFCEKSSLSIYLNEFKKNTT